MKILTISSSFPKDDKDEIPQFVREQAIALKSYRPHSDIHILAPHRNNPAPSDSTNTLFTMHRFHYFWPFFLEGLSRDGIMPALKRNKLLYLQLPFFVAAQLYKTIVVARRIKPDVIYAHWFTPQGINAAIASRLLRIPYVVTSHSMDVKVLQTAPLIGPRIVRGLLPKAAKITVVSARTLTRMKSFFTKEQWSKLEPKVKIIPMGVDLNSFSSTANTKKIKHSILFVGRLAEVKGVEHLLNAVKILVNEFPDTSLTIAGTGPLRNSLEQLATKLEIHNNVSFVGYVSGKDKHKLFAESDVFVLPSIITDQGHSEGFPVVLMEAAAAGSIIVATDTSGAEALIKDNVSGIIIPQRNATAMAEAISQAFAMDTRVKESFRAEAKGASQHLDWNNIAKLHYDFLFKDLEN